MLVQEKHEAAVAVKVRAEADMNATATSLKAAEALCEGKSEMGRSNTREGTMSVSLCMHAHRSRLQMKY